MKILLLNDYASPAGGAEIITLGLRDELRRRGHDARLFGSTAKTCAQPSEADFHGFGTTGPFRTLLQCANFAAQASLRKTLRDFRPDVVHVNLYQTQLSPLILPLLRAVPTVYYAQWYRSICPLGTKRLPSGSSCRLEAGKACLKNRCVPPRDWLPLELQRHLSGRWRGAFNKITAISQCVASKLQEFGGPSFQDVEVIHAGTIEVVERESPSQLPSLFFAGRLVQEKGTDILIRAFAQALRSVPAARLEIAGGGPEASSLAELVTSLGIEESVCFLGHLPNEETSRHMRSAWAVCIPSVWEEPYGFVAAEAQMNGVAVLASRIGGLEEIIQDGKTGFLVKAGDVTALAEKLKLLLTDNQLAVTLGHGAHRHATSSLGIHQFTERFENLYLRIVHPDVDRTFS
jgi:glycosyltransferase involved in cell wall biosynthesis